LIVGAGCGVFGGMIDVDGLRGVFEKNFAERGELGASVSVWEDGVEVLSLARGFCEKSRERVWTEDTMVPVYSATKGPACAVVLMLLEENGLTPEDLVVRVWSGFPNERATFAELLSHQCGLAGLDAKVSVFDFDEVIAVVEVQDMNKEEAWMAGLPAMGGVGTARALAKFYQAATQTPS